jgi:hypothetical protein
MTASGRLRRFCGFCGMSAYPPKLTVEADIPDQTASSSFDHFVGAGEHRRRHFEAEGCGRNQIHDEGKRQRRFSIDRTDTNIGAWSVFDRLE